MYAHSSCSEIHRNVPQESMPIIWLAKPRFSNRRTDIGSDDGIGGLHSCVGKRPRNSQFGNDNADSQSVNITENVV